MSLVTPYDRVKYSNHAYHQCHPDTLATVARLYGLRSPRPSRSRVLELACGAGGNLLGVAYGFPDARCVGVDLAPTAVEEAARLAAGLGIANAQFRQGDVTELGDGRLGEFDYVVAHGLYAWVPDPVREGLMATIASHLSPDGLAYVSYNCEPTGHIRRVIRDAALWWGRDADTPEALADSARELFAVLLDARCKDADDWYAGLIGHELTGLTRALDSELVHDLLGECWRPVWFSDFAAHAARHGLEHVGQARLGEHRGTPLPDGLPALLDDLSGGDHVAREQYLDILTCRGFRESILCRAGRGIRRELDPTAFGELAFRTGLERLTEDDPPALHAAHEAMVARRPNAVPFDELVAATGADAEQLRGVLGGAFRAGKANPFTDLPGAGRPGERPHVSAVARMTAAGGDRVTTLYNGIVFLEDPLGRALITLMDGTRDRDELLAAFNERTGADVTREVLDANIASLGQIPLFHG